MSINKADLERWRATRPTNFGLVPLIPFDKLPLPEHLIKKPNKSSSQLNRLDSKTAPPEIRKIILTRNIASLNRGEKTMDMDIKSALTKVEWWDYQAKLALKSHGQLKVEIPTELKPYLSLLQYADTAYKRPTLVGAEGDRLHAPELLLGYQEAIECLHKIIMKNPEMAQFFNRPLCYSPSGRPNGNPNNMPRMHRIRVGFAKVKGVRQLKREITLKALQVSLSEL